MKQQTTAAQLSGLHFPSTSKMNTKDHWAFLEGMHVACTTFQIPKARTREPRETTQPSQVSTSVSRTLCMWLRLRPSNTGDTKAQGARLVCSPDATTVRSCTDSTVCGGTVNTQWSLLSYLAFPPRFCLAGRRRAGLALSGFSSLGFLSPRFPAASLRTSTDTGAPASLDTTEQGIQWACYLYWWFTSMTTRRNCLLVERGSWVKLHPYHKA